jgi:hypothetical protein
MRDRHHAWGDDAEERDADATVAELVAREHEHARRWYDRPAVIPFKAVVSFVGRNGRRVGVSILGILLILVGLVGLALPILPGWLLIFAGFAVLSTEYVWAERMLRRAKAVAAGAKEKASRRVRRQDDPTAVKADQPSDDGPEASAR